MAIKAVLFDLNGTLLDDAQYIYDCARDVFLAYDTDPPTLDEYYGAYTGDWRDIYSQYGLTLPLEELYEVFDRSYSAAVPKISFAHGAIDIIEELAARQLMTGLITMQRKMYVDPFLPLGMRHRFSCIFTKEDGGMEKADTIRAFADANDLRPNEIMFVGDTLSDIRFSNEAGVISVAYLNGYVPAWLFKKPPLKPVRLYRPDHVIRRFSALLPLIDTYT